MPPPIMDAYRGPRPDDAGRTARGLKKKRAIGSKELPAGQVSLEDLKSLIPILSDGATGQYYSAKWAGYEDTGQSFAGLRDPEDFSGLRSLYLNADYGSQNEVTLHFRRGGLGITWSGPIGADRARRVTDWWMRLPSRAKVSYPLRFALKFLPFAGAFALTVPFAEASQVPAWANAAFLALLLTGLLFLFGADRLFVGRRAERRPFMIERPVGWWRQPQSVLAVLGILAAIVVPIGIEVVKARMSR